MSTRVPVPNQSQSDHGWYVSAEVPFCSVSEMSVIARYQGVLVRRAAHLEIGQVVANQELCERVFVFVG